MHKHMFIIILLSVSSACVEETRPAMAEASLEHHAGSLAADPLVHLPRAAAQLRTLCKRDGDDPIRSLFCRDEPLRPQGIIELQRALHIDAQRLAGINGLAIAGHSTSLGARSISAINPRLISIRLEHPAFDAELNSLAPGSNGRVDPSLEPVALAFARGEQFVELMVRDRIDHELRFYLLRYRQACNDSSEGCKPGDLLTPETEEGWTETTLYDERDLANTVLDCAPCHQTSGPGTTKFLRMQELREPWTHWFSRATEGGRALFDDYFAAKGDEVVFGVPGAELARRTNPVSLELQAVYGGPNDQPNPFDSETIEREVRESAVALGGKQPQDNSVPGESDTWRNGYEAARRGAAITFPYHDVKVTDPSKLAEMTEAYRAYRTGEIDRSQLPDIRDVFPDDLRQLAEMGFTTQPGASGEEVLMEACSMCHNTRLDQSLSRARFRPDLVGMSRAEKERAIFRMRLPEEDARHMPPTRLRFLSAEARARAIAALEH